MTTPPGMDALGQEVEERARPRTTTFDLMLCSGWTATARTLRGDPGPKGVPAPRREEARRGRRRRPRTANEAGAQFALLKPDLMVPVVAVVAFWAIAASSCAWRVYVSNSWRM
jgi:hypothetical protein